MLLEDMRVRAPSESGHGLRQLSDVRGTCSPSARTATPSKMTTGPITSSSRSTPSSQQTNATHRTLLIQAAFGDLVPYSNASASSPHCARLNECGMVVPQNRDAHALNQLLTARSPPGKVIIAKKQ